MLPIQVPVTSTRTLPHLPSSPPYNTNVSGFRQVKSYMRWHQAMAPMRLCALYAVSMVTYEQYGG